MMDDLISRQAAINALIALTVYSKKREIVKEADNHPNTWIEGVAECIDEIEDLPSAQPERKKGCKIVKGTGHYGYCACDQCGKPVHPEDKFCSKCGADFREEDT